MMLAGTRDKLRPSRPPNALLGLCLGFRTMCALVFVVGMIATAVGQSGPQGAGEAERRLDFDIPAQRLSKALYAFSTATSIEILVDARYAEGRQSTSVKGFMAPRDALELLLAGSGLVSQDFGPDTVTLEAAALRSSARVTGVPSGGDPPYFADIQRAVQQVLCKDARTSPGRYRLALKLWIGRYGAVLRSQRLDTTGDESLDAALDAAVQATRIDRPPPPDLPQPVTLVISPRQASASLDCPAGASDVRRALNRRQ
jgi:hypothetical protein